MSPIQRRQWLKQAVTTALLPLLLSPAACTAENSRPPTTTPPPDPEREAGAVPPSEIATAIESECSGTIAVPFPFALQFTVEKSYRPDLSADFQRRLTRAVLSILNQHYNVNALPIWKRPLHEIQFQPRLESIIHWLAVGCERHQRIYPIDPVWIIAQMFMESLFCETAISSASAVGVAQFMRPTAQGYGMICAGDRPEHSAPPFLHPQDARSYDEYLRVQKEESQYREANKINSLNLQECLQLMGEGNSSRIKSRLREHQEYIGTRDRYRAQMSSARERYRQYLVDNSQGKSVLKDGALLAQIDERLTHEKPVQAMVQMLSEHLRARKGNILAAAAGYNAGLSRTNSTASLYKPYGLVPSINETVQYVSKIVVIYHELRLRLD